MVADTLKSTVTLFRPQQRTKTDARTTFEKTTVQAVKLASSSAWVTDGTGVIQSRAGSLFYHPGTSSQYPAELDPLFKEGDIICEETDSEVPPAERFVVKKVTMQTFKGNLHHIEVVLV